MTNGYEVQSEKKQNSVNNSSGNQSFRNKSENEFSKFMNDSNDFLPVNYKIIIKEEEKREELTLDNKNDKKLKNLKKKLRQIEFLEQKLEKGELVTQQEKEKIEKKQEFLKELESCCSNPSP